MDACVDGAGIPGRVPAEPAWIAKSTKISRKMHQAVNLSSVDELVDMIEMFPTHILRRAISALRELLKDTELK